MTEKEAIKQLEGASIVLFNRDYKKFNEAIIMAINALQKQWDQRRENDDVQM